MTTGVGVDPNCDKQGGAQLQAVRQGHVAASASTRTVNVGFNNNKFCCGATASRTAPLITQTVEHGHNPVSDQPIHAHVRVAPRCSRCARGGIYIRDNFTPYSDDFTTPGRTDQATGFSASTARPAASSSTTGPRVDASLAHSASDFLKGSHDFKFGMQTAYATQRTVGVRFGNVSYTDLNSAPYLRHLQRPVGHGRADSVGRRLRCRTTGRVNDRLTARTSASATTGSWATSRRCPPSATLDGINGDATFEVTDTHHVSRRSPDLIDLQHLGRRGSASPCALDQVRQDRVQGELRPLLRQAGDQHVQQHVAGRDADDDAALSTRRRASTTFPFSFVDNKINFSVNSDLNNQYTDQLFVGIERQIAANMGVNVSFVWKEESDFIRLQDVRGTYAPRDDRRHVQGRDPDHHGVQPHQHAGVAAVPGGQP